MSIDTSLQKKDNNIERHFVFIVNPISGTKNKSKLYEIITKSFYDKSHQIIYTEYRGHASEIAKKFSDQENVVLVCVGGDGTLNEIAKELVHQPAKIGILPFGSGNGFAGHAIKNTKLNNCLKVLKKDTFIHCDVLSINKQICCNTCGIGLSGYVAHIFNEKGERGLYNYVKLGLGTFKNFNAFNVYLNEQEFKNNINVEIANSSQLGNNAYISPNSSILDGLAEIVLLKKPNAIKVPKLILDVFGRNLNSNKLIKNLSYSKCKIQLEEEIYYHIDGDYKGKTKLIDLEVIPSSLKLVV